MVATFVFHEDPGHGWLEVTRADMAKVNLSPSDFSGYSYRNSRDSKYYLEEDADATKFLVAWRDRFGSLPKFDNRYRHNTFIRKLPSIRPPH